MHQASVIEPMDYTGERMVPEAAEPDIFWEHIYRYRFAAGHVRGRRVLDVACGEGYGAYGLLKAGAAAVVGVDISEGACEHARRKYGLDARPGSATDMPLDTASVDVVVSFETIEHVAGQAAFLDECRRVLGLPGTLVISTPNRAVYSADGAHNPFHCSELDRAEFLDLLRPRFRDVRLYTQMPRSVAPWSVRSLAAARSPWRNVRGYFRLRDALARGAAFSADDPSARRKPDVLITGTDSRRSRWANPFLVRPESPFAREEASYFVAVARV